MRVLFVSTGDSKYGAPKSMLALMMLLKEQYDVEVVLLTPKHNQLNEYCDNHGIENYSCFYSDMMSRSNYDNACKNIMKHIVKYMLYIWGKLVRSKVDRLGIDLEKIDVIHSNTNRVDIGAYLSEKYNIPHIWHLRELDEGTKNVVYYRKHWDKYMNSHASIFVAISEAVKTSWIKHGLDKDKVKTIYNGIDGSSIEKRIQRKDNLVKIVAVGRVEKNKGQEDLIRAICNLSKEKQSSIEVDFMGEAYGEYKRKLLRIIEKSDCKATVKFLGYCDNIRDQLKNYDIGITCSRAEGFGRTTVEYMMAGLLVIATDTGPNPELILDGKTGLLYQQGNDKSLSDIISGVIDKRYDIEGLCKGGLDRAERFFSATQNANKIYQEYLTLKDNNG